MQRRKCRPGALNVMTMEFFLILTVRRRTANVFRYFVTVTHDVQSKMR